MFFYVSRINEGIVAGEESDHFFAMRLKVSDKCKICDQNGTVATIHIIECNKNKRLIKYEIISSLTHHNSRSGILYQSLIDKHYQEKCIEVLPLTHYSKIVFVKTRHSSQSLPNIPRLEGILQRSTSQCESVFAPVIDHTIRDISDVLEQNPVILHQVGDNSDSPQKSHKNSIHNTCFVGPEGGWSDDEISLFNRENLSFVSFPDCIYPAWIAGLIYSSSQISH